MKRVLRVLLLAVLMAGPIVVLLTKYWYANPESFPSPFRQFGNVVISAAGIQGAEDVADAEFFYVITVSGLLVTVVLFCTRCVLQCFRRKDKSW